MNDSSQGFWSRLLEVWQGFLEWLSPPPEHTPWDYLNSEFVVAIATILVGYILQRGVLLGFRGLEARQVAIALEKRAEEDEEDEKTLGSYKAEPIGQETEDFREEALGEYAEMKRGLKQMIQRDSSAENQRTYKRLRWYSLRPIIYALHDRDQIEDWSNLEAMLGAVKAWSPYQRQGAKRFVPKGVSKALREGRRAVERELAK